VDGPLAAHKMITAIRTEISSLPDFDPVLIQLYQDELRHEQDADGWQQRERDRRKVATDREIENVLAAIREVGHSPRLLQELSRLEKQQEQLAWEEHQRQQRLPRPLTMPAMAEIKAKASEAFDKLAVASPEFG